MLRIYRDETPAERELTPVIHGIHVIVCSKCQYYHRMDDKPNHITAKVDLIVIVEGSPRGREGQLKVSVDHSDRTGQKKEGGEVHHCFWGLAVEFLRRHNQPAQG